MIVPFVDNVFGTPVYLNPAYVMSFWPDPGNPEEVTIVKLRDGKPIRVRGDHEAVARKLQPAA